MRHKELELNKRKRYNKHGIEGVFAKIQEEQTKKQLADQTLRLTEHKLSMNFSILISVITLVFACIMFIYYRRQKELGRRLSKINQKMMEQNELIEIKNSDLELLNTKKNDLINIVAHDLRSPLNSVKGLVNITKLESDESEKDRFMDLIVQSTDRMTDMVNRILDVSALESKELNLRLEKIELVNLINQLKFSFINHAKVKEQCISIVANFDNAWLDIDENYFIQVLENLVSNAIKYSEYNTEIKIVLTKHNQKLRVSVEDQGQGISEGEMGKLFKEFSTLSSKTTAGEKATGLGLSIVKKYVEAMKGEIWCESELGIGSKFIMEYDMV